MVRKLCDECGSKHHTDHDLNLLYKKRWRDKNKAKELDRIRRKGYKLKHLYPNIELKHITIKEWKRLLNARCSYCDGAAGTIDHVIPLSKGGRHSIGNVLPACMACNRAKHTQLLVQYMSMDNRVGTRAWRKIRDAVLERDGWTCHYCRAEATTVDHVIPRSKGGTNEQSNLVAACVRCNASKGNRTAPRKAFFYDSRTQIGRAHV